MLLFSKILIIFVAFLGLLSALPRGDSLRELHKLLLQQQQLDEQQQQQPFILKFNEDLDVWIKSLEEMGLNFMSLVEECRPRHSHCSRLYVHRKLRLLKHHCRDLQGQLENLEISYLGKISEEDLLMPTLRALRGVLQPYDGTLRMITAESYKLINQ